MGTKLPRKINKDTERKGMGFDIPNGKYLVEVMECEAREPKDGGDTYIATTFEILDSAREAGEHCIGFKIFDQFSLSEKASWRLEGFLDACYPPRFDGDEIPDTIIGKQLVVDTKMEEYQGFERTRCRSFLKAAPWKGITQKIDKSGNVSDTTTTESAINKSDGKEEVLM